VNFTKITDSDVNLELSAFELKSLRNILIQIQGALPETEFQTRVGASLKTFSTFLENIEGFYRTEETPTEISISLNQIILLNNLFNEACNGIRIDDFEKKIGISKEEINSALDKVNTVMNKMISILEEKRKSYIVPPSYLQGSDYNCTLEADGYRVNFVFKKLLSFKESVTLSIILSFTSSKFAEFSISTIPKGVNIGALHKFIKEFNQYIEYPVKDNTDSIISTQIFQSDIFQVQALGRFTTLDGEEYINLNFMISLAQFRGDILRPFIGIQGAITFTNIRHFVVAMEEILIKLSD